MLQVNDIFKIDGDESLYRILAIFDNPVNCVVIDIHQKEALPFEYEYDYLLDLQQRSLLSCEIEDPFASRVNLPDSHFSNSEIKKRDKLWPLIEAILTNPDKSPNYQIFGKKDRAEKIRDVIENFNVNVSERTLLRKLILCWQRGQVKNAIIPDYHNCGAKGKQRDATNIKLGRKSDVENLEGDGPGIPITFSVRAKLVLAYQKNKTSKLPLSQLYIDIMGEFFAIGAKQDKKGKKKPILPHPNDRITMIQFRYQWNKLIHENPESYLIGRYGKSLYNRTKRPLIGKSGQMAPGPGSIYQIDMTPLDVYAVSKFFRGWVIGKPNLYTVVDMFSHLVVGFLVTLENASWMTAALSLEAAFDSKVKLGKYFGFEIEEREWPSIGICRSIIFDRGEGISFYSTTLPNSLGIQKSNTPPFEPDAKGLVESLYNVSNKENINWIPGTTYDLTGRVGHDYQLDAALTTQEIGATLFLTFKAYNKTHIINDYPFDPQMLADNVIANPLELWNWGIENRTGILRKYKPKTHRIALLPRETGSITERGLYFRKRLYISKSLDQNQWQVRAREWGREKVEVVFDPRILKNVHYLDPISGEYETATLHPIDAKWATYNLEEWRFADAIEKLQLNDRLDNMDQEKSDKIHEIKHIVENAINEKKAALKDGEKMSLKNISGKRAFDRAAERDQTRWIEGDTSSSQDSPNGEPDEDYTYVPPPDNTLRYQKWDEELQNDE